MVAGIFLREIEDQRRSLSDNVTSELIDRQIPRSSARAITAAAADGATSASFDAIAVAFTITP